MITKNPMQLKAYIKKKAAEKHISAQLVMQNYMLERLLERISLSPYTEEASNIFSKHPTGLQFPDNTQHFGPEVAFIVEAALPPCGGERLARKTT